MNRNKVLELRNKLINDPDCEVFVETSSGARAGSVARVIDVECMKYGSSIYPDKLVLRFDGRKNEVRVSWYAWDISHASKTKYIFTKQKKDEKPKDITFTDKFGRTVGLGSVVIIPTYNELSFGKVVRIYIGKKSRFCRETGQYITDEMPKVKVKPFGSKWESRIDNPKKLVLLDGETIKHVTLHTLKEA